MNATLADWRSGVGVTIACAIAGGVTGALFLGDAHRIAASALLAGTMGAITIEDMRSMRVPNAWILPAAIGGFVAVAVEAGATDFSPLIAVGHSVVSLILCGGVFYVLREAYFRWRGVEGLGLGDVKLAATGGIWLGWEIFPAVVTLSAVGAILWIAAVVTLRRSWPRDRRIPFAAFLAPAIWICWIYSQVMPTSA